MLSSALFKGEKKHFCLYKWLIHLCHTFSAINKTRLFPEDLQAVMKVLGHCHQSHRDTATRKYFLPFSPPLSGSENSSKILHFSEKSAGNLKISTKLTLLYHTEQAKSIRSTIDCYRFCKFTEDTNGKVVLSQKHNYHNPSAPIYTRNWAHRMTLFSSMIWRRFHPCNEQGPWCCVAWGTSQHIKLTWDSPCAYKTP